MKKLICAFTVMALLAACGGSSTPTTQVIDREGASNKLPVKATDNLAIPNNQTLENYQVLILGNSHVKYIEPLLETIFRMANKNVIIETRTGAFLDTIVNSENIIEVLQNRQWSHVILQGQKYSQSQSVLYPTDATILWIQRAKSVGATPILFPEHPPAGKAQEAEYVHRIHQSIADVQFSCVAPVGLTWNKVLSISPNLPLHQGDGNHATELGAVLSSFVLYDYSPPVMV